MKFVVVVMLAIAASVSAGLGPVVDVASSWSPVGSWGPAAVNSWGAHGAHGGPWGGAHGAPWAGAHGAPWGAAPWGGAPWGGAHWGGAPWGAPHITLSQGVGHGPVGPSPVIGHGHDAQYVASNRGSVHVAPLVGHAQSVASSNVEPAPGTTW